MVKQLPPLAIASLIATLCSCASSTSPSVPIYGYMNTVVGNVVLATGDSSYFQGVAQFTKGDQKPGQYVDSLSINGTPFAFSNAPVDQYLDTVTPPGDPQFTWHVIGNSAAGIPSFDHTVTSPSHVAITFPVGGDTVFRARTILINWSPVVQGGSINVQIQDAGQKIHGQLLQAVPRQSVMRGH